MHYVKVKSLYLAIERHIYAVVLVIIGIVPALVTHPEERGGWQVYNIQRNGGDGKDGSRNIHKHSEAHLRGKKTHHHTHSAVWMSFNATYRFTRLTKQEEGNCPATMEKIPVTMNWRWKQTARISHNEEETLFVSINITKSCFCSLVFSMCNLWWIHNCNVT